MKPKEYFKFNSEDEETIDKPPENNFREKEVPTAEALVAFFESDKPGIYKIEGFDANQALEATNGPFLEIGGPSDKGFEFVDMEKLPREIFVSNLYPGAPKFDNTTDFLKFYGKVDLQADGRNLPIRDESMGAVFVRALGNIYDPSQTRYENDLLGSTQKSLLFPSCLNRVRRPCSNTPVAACSGLRTLETIRAIPNSFSTIRLHATSTSIFRS